MTKTESRPSVRLVVVYCPRGCNQITVSSDEPWHECGACGQIMRAEYENDYLDSLFASGQLR